MLAGHYHNLFFDYGEKISIRFVRAERDKVRPLTVCVNAWTSAAPCARCTA